MSAHVSMSGVTHRFGSLLALDSVDFSVGRGKVHALVGENGAGKTTLMRILYGALQPTGGEYSLGGVIRKWRDSADAIRHGVGMVSQHYSIIPELTCRQNLVLGAEGAFFLSAAQQRERASALAAKMGFAFEWEIEAGHLTPASAQKLEIVKLLWRESQTMILDEPTAMLSPLDADALYGSLRQLADGGATVIVVTHRIPEVMHHCDAVTVLRGGRKVAETAVSGTSAAQLAEMIVGHAVERAVPIAAVPGAPILEVKGLSVLGHRGDEAVKGATFEVREGEVVGLAGVDGNGQRELFHALIGTLPARGGSVLLCGEDVTRERPRARIGRGVRLIPEDRHLEGVIEEWSLIDNAALGLQRLFPLADGPVSDLRERASLAERVANRFGTKHGGLFRPMRSLSGGNQQRFVAARSLELGPRLLLAFQPTRGLDIDGTAKVYSEIRTTCRAGAGALVVGYDLDELLENCDRTIVICGGRVSEPPRGQERDRLAIGRLMVGAG